MKTAIVIPAYDGAIMGSIIPALMQCHDAGLNVTVLEGQSLICRARSYIATQMLRDFDVLLWVDSDVLFSFDDVRRILETPAHIVGGYYPKRGPKEGWALTIAHESERVSKPEAWPPECVEALGIGFGFIKTHREAFTAVQERFGLFEVDGTVPFFIPALSPNGVYLGEDYSFLMRARACGFPVYAHTGVVLRHRGKLDYAAEHAGEPPPVEWREPGALRVPSLSPIAPAPPADALEGPSRAAVSALAPESAPNGQGKGAPKADRRPKHARR